MMIRIVIYNEIREEDGVYTTCLWPGDYSDRSWEAICDYVREKCEDIVPLVTPLEPLMGVMIRGRVNEQIKEYFNAKYPQRHLEIKDRGERA
jgi:hypothetical protein